MNQPLLMVEDVALQAHPPSSPLETLPYLVLRVCLASARAALRRPSRRVPWLGAHSRARTSSADVCALWHGCCARLIGSMQSPRQLVGGFSPTQ